MINQEPKIAIYIPARMGSTRLPDKPLADINGMPMIIHVAERAREANLGKVVIACAEEEILDIAKSYKHAAVLTDPDLPSGTDRIYQAAKKVNEDADIIINLQGDLPTIDPNIIKDCLIPFKQDENIDITTLVAKVTSLDDVNNPNVVKPAIAWQDDKIGRALYFSRKAIPHNSGEYYHHIGIYAYRRSALEKFVNLPASALEKTEKLEQLRALEAHMRIDVVKVDTVPIGVDTEEDLIRAREYHENN